MSRRLLSIVKQSSNSSQAPQSRVINESDREEVLVGRLLTYPVALKPSSGAPDSRLVYVASVLLDSRLTLVRAFNWETCDSSALRILLFVYVRQGEDKELSIRSLRNLSVLGPGTVSLRWTAKLLDDGILELLVGAEPEDRLIRFTADGIRGIEHWLRCIDFGIRSGRPESELSTRPSPPGEPQH